MIQKSYFQMWYLHNSRHYNESSQLTQYQHHFVEPAAATQETIIGKPQQQLFVRQNATLALLHHP